MFPKNNFLKINEKYIILIALTIGIITYQFVRVSFILFYLYLAIIIFSSFKNTNEQKLTLNQLLIIPIVIYFFIFLLGMLFLCQSINKIKSLLYLLNSWIIPIMFYFIFLKNRNKLSFEIQYENIIIFLTFISCIIALIEFVYYIFIKHSTRDRVISIFFNPNTFAYYIVAITPLIINKYKKMSLQISILFFVVILLTNSRTGLIIYFTEIILLNYSSIKKNYLKLLVPFSFILLIFSRRIIYRIPKLENLKNYDDAVSLRLQAIEFSIKKIKDLSFFKGIGVGQFYDYYKITSDSGRIILHSAHNMFLNIFVEYGIIGFVLIYFLTIFCIIIASFLYFQRRRISDFNILIAFIMITIFQFFDMAEIGNIRMIPLNIVYIYYVYKILSNFGVWREIKYGKQCEKLL
ncbi:O-antigen ligase family protein [Caldicellulosiruptoraceae bacterium PP1]